MKNRTIRRYIFLSYEDIKQLKIKKLEKVCDKAFMFIASNETLIPFQIVSQLQGLGKTIRWIPVECADKDVDLCMKIYMSFWIGKLHEQKYLDVEFAILSEDVYFDNLIQVIKNDGRKCQRVVNKNQQENKTDSEKPVVEASGVATEEEDVVEQTAIDTIRQLKRTDNRPNEVYDLKQFIRVQNSLDVSDVDPEEVVHCLEQYQQISISNGEVIYNF